MRVLDKTLPVWVAPLAQGAATDRLDNNWYSPSAAAALHEMRRVAADGKFRVTTLGELCPEDGINPGRAKEAEEGTVGMVEGKNLRPNYVLPVFTKQAAAPTAVMPNDLLVGKDGEPGTVAVITKGLLEYCEELAIGVHVYLIRLRPESRELAPFVSAFLNSRHGQALVRRFIAGGTTPTLRKTDMGSIPVIVPADGKCPDGIRKAVEQTQVRVIESMDNMGPSHSLAGLMGMEDAGIRLPTNWAGGGAQRSSRIIR